MRPQRAEGSAGRADALVVAFAARRAIDRGVALGYLENLLVDRFGAQHRAAVATIITASHQPVRLDDLISEYEALGPELRRGGPQDSWWTNFKRELGSIVELHSAARPAANPEARYERALQRLASGNVDEALAETMRLPGASRAGDWIGKARRYIARPPRARRDRVRRAAASAQRTALTAALASDSRDASLASDAHARVQLPPAKRLAMRGKFGGKASS